MEFLIAPVVSSSAGLQTVSDLLPSGKPFRFFGGIIRNRGCEHQTIRGQSRRRDAGGGFRVGLAEQRCYLVVHATTANREAHHETNHEQGGTYTHSGGFLFRLPIHLGGGFNGTASKVRQPGATSLYDALLYPPSSASSDPDFGGGLLPVGMVPQGRQIAVMDWVLCNHDGIFGTGDSPSDACRLFAIAPVRYFPLLEAVNK